MKIISLLPSSTEIVCALGHGDSLVGRSHECDFPEEVTRLPICSHPKARIDGSSHEIHENVTELLQKSLSIYALDIERLQDLKPDLILTQDQCAVCAVSKEEVESAVCSLLDSRPQILSLKTNCLEDFWKDCLKVAEMIGDRKSGEALVQSIQNEMNRISKRAASLKTPRPKIATLEWIDPLMTAGNWVPELIEKLGAENLFGEAGKHSPYLSLNRIVQKDPDIIVVMLCGWSIERAANEMKTLTGQKEWQSLRAVKESQVFITDGNQYFNRPGPRLLDSFKILAEIFYPETFHFGYEGKGWKRWK